MSRSLNRVCLMGNLGQSADVKYTPNGTTFATLNIATERRWKDKNSDEWKSETDWHRVVVWRVENIASYLTKGTKVLIEGRLQTRSYDKDGEKRYVTEVISDNLILLGGAPDKQASQGVESEPPNVGDDDSVPF